MSCLLTGYENLANRELAQGLVSAYLCRHYSIPAHWRPQRNLRESFSKVRLGVKRWQTDQATLD